jgi:hypothetical protein
MFPVGDIDLKQELRLDEWIVTRQLERQRIRPIYKARVKGESTTAAIYQGRVAEQALQEWREEIKKYMSIRLVFGHSAAVSLRHRLPNCTFRHPNILQVWGRANNGIIQATLFHGGAVFWISCY